MADSAVSSAPGSLAPLARYRPLIDDWEAFAAALERPLPPVVWTNRLRTTPERLRELLEREGHAPAPIGWCPGAFRLADGAAPGRGLLGAAGLYHIQEEVSLLPVELLDLRPGQRVLDLCAAPGGKTARIATALEGRGAVVANDVDWRRLVAVGRNLDRLGLVNVAATAWDAANFPESGGLFDRVLADVPCTCEGTSRKNPGVLEWGGEAERRRTAAVQTAILRKAVRLCRPGGRVVYSTCTYAPEENEAVVDAVLREARSDGPGADGPLRLVEARVEGFEGAPGWTSWEGRSFAPELTRALRVWPHVHDTGGFFVAVLEKGAGAGERGERPGPEGEPERHAFEALDGAERERWLGPVVERFGFPEETFAGLRLVRQGAKTLALVARDLAGALAPPARPEPRAAGLAFLHAAMRRPKMTTAAAMAFGAAARRNAVELDRGRAEAYLGRRDVELGPDEAGAMTGDGYVVVRWKGAALGVGWFRGAPGGSGSLRSLFPKRW